MRLLLILGSPVTLEDVRREVGPGHELIVADPEHVPVDHLHNPPIVVVAGSLPAGELRGIVSALERHTARKHSRAPLTERELSVLRLIARGFSNREVARELGLSESTVKTHVSRMLGKLKLRRRTQLAAQASSFV